MKILVADDHPLIVDALAGKLAELGPDVQIMGATDLPSLFERVQDAPDLALIDLVMPGADGWAHVRQVRELKPELPVIILSGHDDSGVMREALANGVRGYILKSCAPAVMISAVRLVLAGGVYVPPAMLGVAASSRPEPMAGEATVAAETAAQPSLQTLQSLLTERQIDVLQLLWRGEPNKTISRQLGISEGTVKVHLAAIFRALNARNRTEAVMMTAQASLEMQQLVEAPEDGAA